MPTTDTTVGRLQLVHPDFGHDGGALLHTKVRNAWTKIADNMNSRFAIIDDIADGGGTADVEHNYKCAFAELRVLVYNYNSGTGEMVRLTELTDPKLSEIDIAAKAGDETTHITVTNNRVGASTADLCLVITQGRGAEVLDDLDDVDLSTPPEDGQAMVYDSASSKWIPGASGDASFKVQDVATNGACTIKGGFLMESGGFEYGTYDGAGSAETDFGGDLSIDLDNLEGSPVNDTTYYIYIDKDKLNAPVTTTDTGRVLYGVEEGQLVLLTDTPEEVSLARFIPIGLVRYATAEWSATVFKTTAVRSHSPLGGYFSYVQKKEDTHDSASTKTVTHNFGVAANLIQLFFYDDSSGLRTQLDPTNFVTDSTTSDVDLDFSSLTFAANDYVEIGIFYVPSVANAIALSSYTFKSDWYENTSTTEVNHNLVDMEDIAGYEVQEWDTTTGRRQNIDRASLVQNFDEDKFYLDWSSLSPSATLKYRVVSGNTAIPVGRPYMGWKLKTAAYTAIVGDKILADTNAVGTFRLTLPPNPQSGDEVEFCDSAVNWGTANVTVDRNGKNINGAASNYTLDGAAAGARFVYVNATTGWRVMLYV
jgi:hypothetical protein